MRRRPVDSGDKIPLLTNAILKTATDEYCGVVGIFHRRGTVDFESFSCNQPQAAFTIYRQGSVLECVPSRAVRRYSSRRSDRAPISVDILILHPLHGRM